MGYYDLGFESRYLYRDSDTDKINYSLRVSMTNKNGAGDGRPEEGWQQLVCFAASEGKVIGPLVSSMDKEYSGIYFEYHKKFLPDGSRKIKENENTIRLELEKIPLEIDSLILVIVKKGTNENLSGRDVVMKTRINGESNTWKTVRIREKEEKEANIIVLGRIFREGYDDWILDSRTCYMKLSNLYEKTIIEKSLSTFISDYPKTITGSGMSIFLL